MTDISGAAAGPSAPAAPITDIDFLLSRPSPFGNETGSLPSGVFEPGEAAKGAIRDAKVLVIGAGGLGSETLHNLALSGFTDVHIIDMDTIDLTNLNRQFLFRRADIGKFKATAAAEFVMKRCPWIRVTPHTKLIQDMPADFYKQFKVIIGGLDNLEARRWLNSLLCSFVQLDADGDMSAESVCIPYIDGGTEGLLGQARVIIPRVTACFECTLDLFPPPINFPLCTTQNRPRKPEHCVAYAMDKLWVDAFPGRAIDKDSPEDMKWLFEQAAARAAEFGIEGVTYELTLGVSKRIIPAVAATNASIAAACCVEAVKIVSFAGLSLDNWHAFNGRESMTADVRQMERKTDCAACCTVGETITVGRDFTVEQLIARIKDAHKLSAPSLRAPGKTLFVQGPPALRAACEANLPRPVSELIPSGSVVVVTDPVYAREQHLEVTVNFEA